MKMPASLTTVAVAALIALTGCGGSASPKAAAAATVTVTATPYVPPTPQEMADTAEVMVSQQIQFMQASDPLLAPYEEDQIRAAAVFVCTSLDNGDLMSGITANILAGSTKPTMHEVGWIEASLSGLLCNAHSREISAYVDNTDWSVGAPPPGQD
jgi:hypothetical protein